MYDRGKRKGIIPIQTEGPVVLPWPHAQWHCQIHTHDLPNNRLNDSTSARGQSPLLQGRNSAEFCLEESQFVCYSETVLNSGLNQTENCKNLPMKIHVRFLAVFLQSLQNKSYNHFAAIYYLLVERLRAHRSSFPVEPRLDVRQRRPSTIADQTMVKVNPYS